jgi:hypothetical protein
MQDDYKLPIERKQPEASFSSKVKSGIHWAATKDLLEYLPFNLSAGNKIKRIPLDQFERQYGVGEKRADLDSLGLKAKSLPFYKKNWFKSSMFWGRRLAFLSGAAASALLINYSNQNRADLAAQAESQRVGLENYLSSSTFDSFARDIERKSLWTMNFIAKEPLTAHQLLPEVAQAEEKSRQLDWSLYVMPITQENYSRQALIDRQRKIFSLLAKRGYNFGSTSRIEGKNIIFNQAVPSMNSYLKANPADQFPLIVKNPEFQDRFMKALAQKFGSANQYDIERLGSLYKTFGAAMYEDQRASAAKSRMTFTSIK